MQCWILILLKFIKHSSKDSMESWLRTINCREDAQRKRANNSTEQMLCVDKRRGEQRQSTGTNMCPMKIYLVSRVCGCHRLVWCIAWVAVHYKWFCALLLFCYSFASRILAEIRAQNKNSHTQHTVGAFESRDCGECQCFLCTAPDRYKYCVKHYLFYLLISFP